MRLMLAAAMIAACFAPVAIAQTAPRATATPAPTGDKLRCKRFVETGNLAKSTRVCHTAVEWDRLQRQGRAQTESMQQPGAPPRAN